jgi:hypothetical protein
VNYHSQPGIYLLGEVLCGGSGSFGFCSILFCSGDETQGLVDAKQVNYIPSPQQGSLSQQSFSFPLGDSGAQGDQN